MSSLRVAVIDDEETAARQLQRVLEQEGFEVEIFHLGYAFISRMRQNPFHLAFIDLQLPDIDGLEILRQMKISHEDAEAIIVTGHASIESAIEATRIGAFHYLTKPCKRHDIRLLARRAKEKLELREENRRLKLAMGKDHLISGLVGSSEAMQQVYALIRKVAMVNCNVLLMAETGTGKQMVARAIHALGPRKEKPFVYFNCGGFTEELIGNELFGHEKGAFTGADSAKAGLFEAAAGGTVLLDEIGEMPLSMQVKLLHVLQERQVIRLGGVRPIDLDIRIIAATNKNLEKQTASGRFREDLFYRLSVIPLHIPPLRERREDIPALANHFLKKLGASRGVRFSEKAMALMKRYDWPGNIRELQNSVERCLILRKGNIIEPADINLPTDKTSEELEIPEIPMGGLSLEDFEKGLILKALEKSKGNRSQAARLLKIPRHVLIYRLEKFGIT